MTTPSQRPATAPELELDVRDVLRAGGEPFPQIMAAVESLGAAEVLHLRATFEPKPLLNLLGSRGFAHETKAHAPDDWSAWFWRAGE
ncbi:MAG TPA: DUF2249 domain-containing protein [Gemmatimonadaceae bacterium]